MAWLEQLAASGSVGVEPLVDTRRMAYDVLTELESSLARAQAVHVPDVALLDACDRIVASGALDSLPAPALLLPCRCPVHCNSMPPLPVPPPPPLRIEEGCTRRTLEGA